VRLDPEHWPVELLPELRQVEREHPEGSRIFNDFLYGGFLIYFTPGLKVFIDDRCELYGDDWLLQFSEAMHNDPQRVADWRREYGFQYALVAAGSVLDHYFEHSSFWSSVRRTRTANLYKYNSETRYHRQ
jgi:hypothetical protein